MELVFIEEFKKGRVLARKGSLLTAQQYTKRATTKISKKSQSSSEIMIVKPLKYTRSSKETSTIPAHGSSQSYQATC